MRSPPVPARAVILVKPMVAGAALALVLLAFPAARADVASEDPLDRARAAVEGRSFNGVVQVEWQDAGGRHAEDLFVQAAGGSVEVRGDMRVMAAHDRAGFVRSGGDEWDVLWSGALPYDRPDVSAKYELVPTSGQPVAGRATTGTEVRQDGTALERLFFDTETGLLVRREQLDRNGVPTRVVRFVTLSLDPGTPTPRPPASMVDHSARRISERKLSSSFPAPAALERGYRRVGIFAEEGVVHVLYTDGLYELSVFEQNGRLETRDVPDSGRRVRLGTRQGWAYAWPGGHILLWQAGHTVYTAVSDAPVEQLLVAARSLPAAAGAPSLVDRLRRACRAIIAPLE